jgi:hypothetical protein
MVVSQQRWKKKKLCSSPVKWWQGWVTSEGVWSRCCPWCRLRWSHAPGTSPAPPADPPALPCAMI